MSETSRGRPSAAMVVAIIALVVATTGSAIAGPLKTMIDGSSIKKHSIPGNRLIDHTLTGQQINLQQLGAVPHAKLATKATTATNALKLAGQPAASFLPASKVLRWNLKMNKGHSSVITYGPVKFTASCQPDGAATKGELDVSTTEPGTYVNREADAEPGTGMVLPQHSTTYNVVEQDTTMADDGNSSEFEAFDTQGKVAIFSTAQTIGVAINTPGAACRFFGFLVNDA